MLYAPTAKFSYAALNNSAVVTIMFCSCYVRRERDWTCKTLIMTQSAQSTRLYLSLFFGAWYPARPIRRHYGETYWISGRARGVLGTCGESIARRRHRDRASSQLR